MSKKANSSSTKTRFTPVTVVILVLLALYTAFLIWLLVWSLLTSFKSWEEFRLNVLGLPEKWVWNYSFVLGKYTVPVPSASGVYNVPYGMMFLYSVLYAGGCAFTATLVPCITSYLCARFPYKFGKVVYTVVIIAMILPVVGNLPSEILVAKTFGFFDQIWGLWLMKANFLGMYFLVFYGVFKGLPKTYTEAAKIDGAGNLAILFEIMLPLVKTTFFTVMLINFIGFWNDYQTPLIYLPHYPTVAYGMQQMSVSTEYGMSTIPMRMTGAMLMFIPIFAVFLIFQNRLMANLTMGGIKE